MENNLNENVTYKKKGNIAVIILIIVVLVLIGLLSYKMFIYDKKDNKENKDNDIVNKDDNKNNEDNNSKTNYDNKHLSKIDVDSTRGFVLYASHSSELYESKNPGKIGLVASSVIDKNGDVYFELYKDVKVEKEFNNLGEKGSYTIEGYKLPLRNIRDVKSYSFGQAGMSGIFVFIDKENNASVMKVDYDYSSGDKIVVKDINLYKNVANNIISSIDEYNGNSRNFYLIDKDNNYYVFK